MGKRREPRKDIKVPVRIFGTDRSGQVFSEKVFTTNVSRHGAELVGVQAQINKDEIIGLTYGTTKCHFRVMWTGPPGTPKNGHIGLLNLAPEKSLWDFPLPPPSFDGTVQETRDRRAHPRFKTTNSVELYPNGQNAPIRSRTVDMSVGGCFVDMPNPLPKNTSLRIGIWVRDTKVWAEAKVITSTPGFGIGIQFTQISEPEREQLNQFLQSTIRIAR
jgi:hypothetical protein